MKDNCSLLLLWDMCTSGQVEGGVPDLGDAVGLAEEPDAWRSRDWLLAYEAVRHGWAKPDEFMKQRQWKELLDLDVSFFDPPSVPTPSGNTTAPAPSRRTPDVPSQDESPASSDADVPDAGQDSTEDEGESDDSSYE